MILDALLAVFGFWLVYQGTYWFRMQYCPEPILIAPVVGLLLGDLQTGIIMGAALEAIFLGVMVVGGERPSDPAIAATVSTYFAIKSGLDVEAALAIAYPVAILGSSFNTLARGLTFAIVPWMQKIVLEERNMKKYNIVCLILMFTLSFGAKYLAAFIAIALGDVTIGAIQTSIPSWLVSGLASGGRALAAVGMAITLVMLWDKEIIVWFFVGFIAFKTLGLSLIQIAVIGVAIAITYAFLLLKVNKTEPVAVQTEGDDFDL